MLVFVYGSLKRGEFNHKVLGESKFIGKTKVRGRIYDLGHYPGAKLSEDGEIHGEVFDVDNETLNRLDRLEGHPHFYERKECDSPLGVVSVYELKRRMNLEDLIPSGEWKPSK